MEETKQMSPSSTNIIELDKAKINEAIASEGRYTDEGLVICPFTKPLPFVPSEGQEQENPEETTNNYSVEIERNNNKYIGVVNPRFQRHLIGKQFLENGDQYFGNFFNDQRNQTGIYFWNTKLNEDRLLSETFYGQWKDNKKADWGTYLWTDENKENPQYDTTNFDCYTGELKDEKYTRGTYLSKSENDYYLYHGNFDSDCKKSDENAFFYTSQLNRIFHGSVNKDLLVKGYIAYFDENSGDVKELVYCEFKEDGTIELVKRQKEFNEDEIEEELKIVKNFKFTLGDISNIFAKIYKRYTKIQALKDECNDIGIFEAIQSGEENTDILENAIGKIKKYNKKSVFNYIEENYFGREFE